MYTTNSKTHIDSHNLKVVLKLSDLVLQILYTEMNHDAAAVNIDLYIPFVHTLFCGAPQKMVLLYSVWFTGSEVFFWVQAIILNNR